MEETTFRSIRFDEVNDLLKKHFREPKRTLHDITEAMKSFPSLNQFQEVTVASSWSSESHIVINGSIPYYLCAVQYLVPIAITIPNKYPDYAPEFKVIPPEDTNLKKNHKLVNQEGKCEMMELTWWRSEHNFLEILNLISTAFQKDPPLYSTVKPVELLSPVQPKEYIPVESTLGGLYVKSAGPSHGNFVEIQVNGALVEMKDRVQSHSQNRGIHMVILNDFGGVQSSLVFDTIGMLECDLFARAIEELAPEKIVIIGFKGNIQLSEIALKAFESIGSKRIREFKDGGSYAIVGKKGCLADLPEELENYGATTSINTVFDEVKKIGNVQIPTPPQFTAKASDNDELEESCVICLENGRSYAFVPCGHKCICDQCAANTFNHHIKMCPMCRQLSIDIIKIY